MKRTQIIETTVGKVRGYKDDELEIFKGIPYAEPPIGDLRFKPPVTKKKRKIIHETLDYGPICIQNLPPEGDWPDFPQSESHSLTLNIWTKNTDSKNKPVMVRIHGGGLDISSGRLEDEFKLARRSDIVVVTLNYRLGPLGFFVLPGEEINIGMLDQIEALKWIQKNIEFFGGDPSNVTIFGISAGGWSVSTLMSITEAKGLFKRVIAQSGALHPASFQTKKRKELTERIMQEVNVEKDDVESYRKVSSYEIFKAYAKISQDDVKKKIPFVLDAGPFIDGTYIPDHPLKRIKSGFASEIDLLIGTTLDEAKLTSLWDPSYQAKNDTEAYEKIEKVLKMIGFDEQKAKRLFDTYKLTKSGQDILNAFFADFDFRISAIRMAEAQSNNNSNTYMYLFDYPLSDKKGKEIGAIHGADSSFTFGTIDLPNIFGAMEDSNEAKILEEQHLDCWISFAKTGNPNHKNIPNWPVYDIKDRATMIFGKNSKIVEDPNGKERTAWDGMLTVN